jgi:hypothetical protein
MSKIIRMRTLRGLALGLLGAALLAGAGPASAFNSFLRTWQSTYLGSSTDAADCAVCHGTTDKNLNEYGKSLCDEFRGVTPADIANHLKAIESLNSDRDATGSDNGAEIDANAQPGWTSDALNQLYSTDVGAGCPAIGSPISAPSTVPLPYDPPVGGAPVAIPGGPYAGNIGVPVTFDGSGSYDSDGGALLYAWDFGDGSTGAGAIVKHAYAQAGEYIVTLTVTDDELETDTNAAKATISASPVLDLDPIALRVTKSVQVGKDVAITLEVSNPGPVLGQAIATVLGTQNGREVYRWRLNVYDFPGGRGTSFTFPAYHATTPGTISWSATIADKDPDEDLVRATTAVK